MNDTDWKSLYFLALEEVTELNERIDRLSDELNAYRRDAPMLVRALDCAVQLLESFYTFWPVGHPMPSDLNERHGAWRETMDKVAGVR